MTTTISDVFQSKWGYHPVSREASKKLRTLNRVFQTALRLCGARQRWENKLPQNRIQKRAVRDGNGQKIGVEVVTDANGQPVPMPEPQECPLFAEKSQWKSGWERTADGKVRHYKRNLLGERILTAARLARTPMETPEAVTRLSFTEEEIDKLYQQAVEWENSR